MIKITLKKYRWRFGEGGMQLSGGSISWKEEIKPKVWEMKCGIKKSLFGTIYYHWLIGVGRQAEEF